jgi:hypothetical protein
MLKAAPMVANLFISPHPTASSHCCHLKLLRPDYVSPFPGVTVDPCAAAHPIIQPRPAMRKPVPSVALFAMSLEKSGSEAKSDSFSVSTGVVSSVLELNRIIDYEAITEHAIFLSWRTDDP